MRTFTLKIDSKMEMVLDQLKDDLAKPSRAEIFRLAIALLKIVTEAKNDGLKVTLSNRNLDEIVREIVLP